MNDSRVTSTMDEVLIEPHRGFAHYWRDLWRYRELFYVLSWRDVAVRYKQTVAGAAWAVAQPFISMLVMTVVFGMIADLPSEGNAPYAIMVFAAMLPWQFFSNAVLASSQSIVSNASLVSKVYFPRLIIPTSPILVSLVDFAVSASILVAMMVWFQFWPTWRVLALPGLVALAILAALGPALAISALTVRYRDFRFVVPFLVQFGLYASPVAYSTSVVHERVGEFWFLVYSTNPMVGVIDGFRWAILGEASLVSWPSFVVSVAVALAMFWLGLRYFRSAERSFSDYV